MTLRASRVGVFTELPADRYCCTRCGGIRKVNVKREKTRSGWLCVDCKIVLRTDSVRQKRLENQRRRRAEERQGKRKAA